MADRPQLSAPRLFDTVRIAEPEWQTLERLLFARYPDKETGAFIRYGWRETPEGLLLTLTGVELPGPGDVDSAVPNIRFLEPYISRMVDVASADALGIGVVHSHPEGCRCAPSDIDDDMDEYFSSYYGELVGDRPYLSLIFSRRDGRLHGSGRILARGEWTTIERILVVPEVISMDGIPVPPLPEAYFKRRARLVSGFGKEAAERLSRATVGVVGAGGSGSPAIEMLARAGVGRIITVDPDLLEDSNLERVHGSVPADADGRTAKVRVAQRHVAEIAPGTTLVAYRGALPQREIIDALVHADIVLGCTDQHHSRLALSDLSTRYLVPVIDCGALLEGHDGAVTGLVLQFVRLFPGDPCAYCRALVNSDRVTRELMSPEERASRREAAARAVLRGEDGGAYWRDDPQLNTVGFLTTAAGAVAVGYAIGFVTGRFDMPITRLQVDLVAREWAPDDFDRAADAGCECRRVRGHADQGAIAELVSVPPHWPVVVRLD